MAPGAPESGSGEGGFRARAGALTLLYLVSPAQRGVLRGLLAEATTGVEVVDGSELPRPDDPIDLAIITDPYLVEPAGSDFPPGGEIDEDTMLKPTPAGRELLFVGPVLDRWLARCPAGPLTMGPEAGPALMALLSGWCSMVIHALAPRPLTLDETVGRVMVLTPEVVEERIVEMVDAGLVDVQADGGEERFAVTEWLRLGMAPLAAAARMELRYPPGDTAPIAALDVEATFHLTLPLLRLPQEMSGTCSMAVDLDKGMPATPAGVTIQVEEGRVSSCEEELLEEVDAWAAASAGDWLDTVIEPNVIHVRTGGNRNLARRLLHELHEELFGTVVG